MQTFAAPFPPLSEAARARSLEYTLAGRPEGDLWLFAYGSLMWDAPFSAVESRPSQLKGWQRTMCIWTTLARGSLELPGLGLGLLPGGRCDGLAFRIAASDIEAVAPKVWEREMWTDIYRPTWVPMLIDDVEVFALTFTVNQDSAQFAKDLDQTQTAAHIALAHGERGSCRDYLSSTVVSLRKLGITDRPLEVLLAAVNDTP